MNKELLPKMDREDQSVFFTLSRQLMDRPVFNSIKKLGLKFRTRGLIGQNPKLPSENKMVEINSTKNK